MKVSPRVWWNYKGILYYENLQSAQTLNSELDCQQFDRLKQEIDQKWSKLARHTSLMTCQKVSQLGWEVLMHPPCMLCTQPLAISTY